MKRPFYRWLLPALCFAAAPVLFAQQVAAPATATIVFKDGRTLATPALSRNGDTIMVTVQVGAGSGQVGYAIPSIERIEFPEPPQLKAARDLLTQGKIPEGLAALSTVIRAHEPFRDVPGSYWAQAVALKLNAGLSTGNEPEDEALVGQLKAVSGNPEIAQLARAQEAANWARKGDFEKALPICEAVIRESTDRETLAVAWLGKGHSLLGLKQWEPAALAYLHLPVFYPENRLLLAPALLGSARALAALGDIPAAELRFNDLMQMLPTSPAAVEAKAELEKLQKKKP